MTKTIIHDASYNYLVIRNLLECHAKIQCMIKPILTLQEILNEYNLKCLYDLRLRLNIRIEKDWCRRNDCAKCSFESIDCCFYFWATIVKQSYEIASLQDKFVLSKILIL